MNLPRWRQGTGDAVLRIALVKSAGDTGISLRGAAERETEATRRVDWQGDSLQGNPIPKPEGRLDLYRRTRYFPALDGLRAFCVTIVMFNHMHVPQPRIFYGPLGVEGFFVLSGFLITMLMLREQHEHGRISLTAFYTRRFLGSARSRKDGAVQGIVAVVAYIYGRVPVRSGRQRGGPRMEPVGGGEVLPGVAAAGVAAHSVSGAKTVGAGRGRGVGDAASIPPLCFVRHSLDGVTFGGGLVEPSALDVFAANTSHSRRRTPADLGSGLSFVQLPQER